MSRRPPRERDELGRPLGRAAGPDAFPGLAGTPDPEPAAAPPLTTAQALRTAQGLLDAGRPFHAHEVLEDVWKADSTPLGERDLWRGLAQVAVGLTHARRENAVGAVALLRRGAVNVGGFGAVGPHGVAAAAVRDRASELAEWIERDGLAAVPAAELTVRLV